MGHLCWPLFDLRLTTHDLMLRQLTEADLLALSALLPDDAEQDPAATTYDGFDATTNRGVVVHQGYWKASGTWRPESWCIHFAAFLEGELIGTQELEADDFLRLRTVDSASFLALHARGRGFGKQMRRAVLTLAFGPLEAEAAITSAWHDNGASLGVSRSLGYRDNGVNLHRRGEDRDVMAHLRLTREEWIASDGASGVGVEGFEPCRPLFGLYRT